MHYVLDPWPHPHSHCHYALAAPSGVLPDAGRCEQKMPIDGLHTGAANSIKISGLGFKNKVLGFRVLTFAKPSSTVEFIRLGNYLTATNNCHIANFHV